MNRTLFSLAVAVLVACGGGGRDDDPPLPPGEQPPGSDGNDDDQPRNEGPFPNAFPTPLAGEWPEVQTALPAYALTLTPEADALLSERCIDRNFPGVPATFAAEGRSWQVTVECRGRSTRNEEYKKKSYRVHFPDEDRFHGRKKVELLAQYRDGGMLTEKLWYDLATAMGLRVPTVQYVTLTINGRFGVFTQFEAIDKQFLKAHGFDSDSDIFRCPMHDCRLTERDEREPWMELWERKTNEDQPWSTLDHLLQGLNRTPADQFAQYADSALELGDFLTWMAVDEAVGSHMSEDTRSYLIYDRATRKWTYVPWDLNNSKALYVRFNGVKQSVKANRPLMSFSAYDLHAHAIAEERSYVPGIKPAWSVLTTRIIDDPMLRARYVDELERMLLTHFAPEVLDPRIDAQARLIRPYLQKEAESTGLIDMAFVNESAAYLKRYVAQRRAFLLANLDRIKAVHAGRALRIEAVGSTGGGTWVTLVNSSSAPLSLGQFHLTGDPWVPTQSRLPATTLNPGEWVTLFSDGDPPSGHGARIAAQRTRVGLFAADGKTPVELLFLPSLPSGAPRPGPVAAPGP